MDQNKKGEKTRSPELIGGVGIIGEARRGEGRKGRELGKMYSSIKLFKKES